MYPYLKGLEITVRHYKGIDHIYLGSVICPRCVKSTDAERLGLVRYMINDSIGGPHYHSRTCDVFGCSNVASRTIKHQPMTDIEYLKALEDAK